MGGKMSLLNNAQVSWVKLKKLLRQ